MRTLALGIAMALCLVAPAALASGSKDPWLQQVQQNLVDAEYEVTWQETTQVVGLDAAWHAPNRGQGFRTYFAPDGIYVIPRQAVSEPWLLVLRPVRLGRPWLSIPLDQAEVSRAATSDNRMDYHRSGVHEWYVNEPRGLKQNFQISRPPGGAVTWRDNGARLELDLELVGGLSPQIDTDGQVVDLVDARGARVLRYSRLVVVDAAGRTLPSHIEGFDGLGDAALRGLRLVVDDRDAIYPVTIDPLLESPAWSGEGDQLKARFGVSVGTAGDVNGDGYSDVIVGADEYDNGQFDEGRAFLFEGTPAGPSFVAAWIAEGNQELAGFGASVGTAGDVNGDGFSDVIVGADRYDGSVSGAGAVFVYHGSVVGLNPAPSWDAEGAQGGESFGGSVATAGDVDGDGFSDVIVGASGFSNGHSGEGRALLYSGSGSGLLTTPSWEFEGGQIDAQLGVSVGTAGDVNADGYSDVIVGASGHDDTHIDEGRTRVFHGGRSGLPDVPSWEVDGDQAGAASGSAVGTAGDVDGDGHSDVVVGAPLFDVPAEDAGRASVYRGSNAGLLLVPSWIENGDQEGAQLGAAVFAAGDVNGDGYGDVIVGEPYRDDSVVDEGRAQVFQGSTTGLGSNPAWSIEGGQRFALFGFAAATAGDVNGDGFSDVIVGARDHSNGEDSEGRATVYLGAPAGLSTLADWFTDGNDAFGEYGAAVSTAGDVNGDGISDILIGARLYDAPQSDSGRVSVFHGTPTGPAFTPTGVAGGSQSGEEFGTWVASAGDVNGDGFEDIVVGAPFFDNGESAEGRAVVFRGSATGLMAQSWSVEGDQVQARMGGAVASAGDVNGDGYGDVVVVASGYDDPESNEGVAFVYHGSAEGLGDEPAWSAGSNQINGLLSAAGPAGDVNGDGFSDLIVGASLFDNGQDNEGKVFVYHGSPTGLLANPSWTREGDQEDARFGSAVWTAGDINGDGFSDVLVGAPFVSNPTFREGMVFAYNGSPTGLSDVPSWFVESDQDNAGMGVSVSTAGDVNSDGFSDVIVGAIRYSNGQAEEGAAFVYRGSAAGLSTIPSWIGEGGQSEAAFGRSVSTAGDVNGDGFADVLVGARSFDDGETDEGRAFLYYGNDGGGLTALPQQRRSDDLAPIAQRGASDIFDGFRIALSGTSSYGRGRLKLEWEVKPLGQALDGSVLDRSVDWFDSDSGGAAFTELVLGLEQGPQYHWRVRFVHDPVTTPFQQRGRWFSGPINGWQEGDLRMASPPLDPGAVPDGGDVPGTPLSVDKVAGQLVLEWGASCGAADSGYIVYEGTLGFFDNTFPAGNSCDVRPDEQAALPMPFANAFYLVVPDNATHEGSYGTDAAGFQRPPSQLSCLPQAIGACE